MQPEPAIPSSIGGYRVDGVLGRGGSGIVLRVHDEALDRPLALKLLADDLDEEARARFMVEARAAGRIIHPNVVQVYAVGVYEERAYITQELVEGFPLSSLLEVRKKLSPASVIDIGIQTAKGLQRAAEVGVVHRDVKPQNLLVTDDGLVKLADFGLAKLLFAPTAITDVGTALGTPHYMSPEQGLAQDLDARSDQYSLGATLYHLLTGEPPFDADNALALLLKHVQDPLPPVASREPTCPKGLGEVIERMLAKKREDRFESFEAVIEALESIESIEIDGPPIAVSVAEVAKAMDPVAPAPAPAPELIASEGERASGGGGGLRDRVLFGLAVLAALAVVAVAAFEAQPPSVTSSEVQPLADHGPPGTAAGRDDGEIEAKAKQPEGEKDRDKDSKKERRRARQMPAAAGQPPATSATAATSVEAWLEVLAHDPSRAEQAIDALGALGDQAATMPLVHVLENGSSTKLRVSAARALGQLGDTRAIEPLERVVESAAAPEVSAAAKAAAARLFHVDEP